MEGLPFCRHFLINVFFSNLYQETDKRDQKQVEKYCSFFFLHITNVYKNTFVQLHLIKASNLHLKC